MRQRVRSWLFILSILGMILSPLVVGAANRWVDARFQADQPSLQPLPTSTVSASSCVPTLDQAAFTALEGLDTSQTTSPSVSLRMAELYAADQAVRLPVNIFEPQAVNEGDTQRRLETYQFILEGKLHSPRDLVYAAYIFQHGDCTDHYLFAHRLAELAVDAGDDEARWIYAATLDRYLMSLGEPQKFGTQYTLVDGTYTLYQVDPLTTDAERLEYNVPPLSEAMQNLPDAMAGGSMRRQWLASWWTTLIGAGFAALGALIALVDPQQNAPLGRITLIVVALILMFSILGHALQVRSFQAVPAQAQSPLWTTVNILLILLWLIIALVEARRRFTNPV